MGYHASVFMKTFLIIEDAANIRMFVAANLRARGYQVQEARSAEDAIELLRSTLTPVDGIILDIGLPGMDGWTFLDLMQQDEVWCKIPVIVFSAAVPTTDRLYPNLVARLTKPVVLMELIEVVGRAVKEA